MAKLPPVATALLSGVRVGVVVFAGVIIVVVVTTTAAAAAAAFFDAVTSMGAAATPEVGSLPTRSDESEIVFNGPDCCCCCCC